MKLFDSLTAPIVLLLVFGFISADAARDEPSLLIGNTRGGSEIFQYGLESGSLAILIPEGILEAPDHIAVHQGYYYISTGAEVNTSSVVRIPIITAEEESSEVEVFASGGGLKRPYGFDFYGDTLYVASFMTDQILMYSAESGEYTGVFAKGNATEEGLCNGPNQIDIYDDKLYLTTQGSFIDDEGNLNYAFSSQTVVYDLQSGEGEVFIPQPDPDPRGMGFISMLGLKIGCNEDSILDNDCTVYTSDFAGGLRLYSFSNQTLMDSKSTTYAAGAATGSLTLGDDGTVYLAGFVDEDSGAILSLFPDSDPTNNDTLSVVFNSSAKGDLARPIGILFVAKEEEDKQEVEDEEAEDSGVGHYDVPLFAWLFLVASVAFGVL